MTRALFTAAILLFQQTPSGGQHGIITGQVRTIEGNPAAGVRVAAITASDNVSGPGPGASLWSVSPTDNDGRYRLEELPPGRYHVIAGPLEAPTYFPGAPFQTGAREVVVGAGAVASGVDFPLVSVPPLVIRGRFLQNGDMGLLGSRRMTLTSGIQTQTGPIALDGSFEFSNLRPGRYQAAIPGGGVIVDSNVIDLVDRDLGGLEFLVTSTLVKGRLHARGISAIEYRRREELQATRTLKINPDGSFELLTLPGSYNIRPVSESPIPLPDIPITIPSITEVTLELFSPELKRVTGRASVTGGAVAPRFVLRIQGTVGLTQAPGPPGLRPAVTESSAGTIVVNSPPLNVLGFTLNIRPEPDGTFHFFLPQGNYEFGAEFPDDALSPFVLKSITSGGIDVYNFPLTISSAHDVPLQILFAPSGTQ